MPVDMQPPGGCVEAVRLRVGDHRGQRHQQRGQGGEGGRQQVALGSRNLRNER